MKKLPKKILEYIHCSQLSNEELTRLDAWSKTAPAGTEWLSYSENSMRLIPYHIYEMWCRHEEDLLLLTRLKEVMQLAG